MEVPPPQSHEPSSSPILPTVSELFRSSRVSALASGSKASSIPPGAISGFATAGSLLRDKVLSLEPPEVEIIEKPSRRRRKKSLDILKEAGDPDVSDVHTKPAKPTRKRASRAKLKASTNNDASGLGTEGLEASVIIIDDVSESVVPAESIASNATLPVVTTAIGVTTNEEASTKGRRNTMKRSKPNKVDNSLNKKDSESSAAPKVKAAKPSRQLTPQSPGVEQPGKQEAMDSVQLEPALKRRTDWTPIKDTTRLQQAISERNSDKAGSPSQRTHAFINTLAEYSYTEAADSEGHRLTSRTRHNSGEAFTKRRRVELLDVPHPQLDVEPLVKIPKAKKRPLTITDIATSRYRGIYNDAGADSGSSLVVGVRPSHEKPLDGQEAVASKIRATEKVSPVKQVTKSRKGVKKAPKKKKAAPALPKLLSPTAAIRQVNGQNVLFGTSSQLRQPESPTYIRTLQDSLSEAEQRVEDDRQPPLYSRRLGRVRGSRSLWASAARDHDDTLLIAEIPEIPEEDGAAIVAISSEPPEVVTIPVEEAEIAAEAAKEHQRDYEDAGVLISSGEALPDVKPSEEPIEAEMLEDQNPESDGEDLPLPSDDVGFGAFEEFQPDTFILPIRSSSPIRDDTHRGRGSPCRTSGQDRPALQPLPVNLSSPIKSSFKMPPVLDAGDSKAFGGQQGQSCDVEIIEGMSGQKGKSVRASTTRNKAKDQSTKPIKAAATKSVSKASNNANHAAVEPTNPAGTTRKTKSLSVLEKTISGHLDKPVMEQDANREDKSDIPLVIERGWTHIDEIEDSEPELSPSPPNISRHFTSLGPTLQLSPSKEASSSTGVKKVRGKGKGNDSPKKSNSNMSRVPPKSKQPPVADAVFMNITKVIKSAPSTLDPTKLSWHERMLLYEPIIIEDLTEWLREQKVSGPVSGAKGKDGREGPLEYWVVRNWCERNSICCGWKGGSRGRA